MARIESSLRSQSMFEPPKKKRKTQDRTTKKTLLEALKDVEDEIKGLGHDTLQKRLETLRGRVKVVLENQEKEIIFLRGEIQSLKEETNKLKVKQEKLENALAIAQNTWVWEVHLARFVVDDSRTIYEFCKFNQMKEYLKKNPKDDRWTKMKSKLTDRTDKHKKLVKTVRAERNSAAHPDVIDLDLVESEINTTMPPESQKLMKDMLDILKMTASLMKFGRLVNLYDKNKHLFATPRGSGKGIDARALNDIISWNRNFSDINGLQSIHHAEAKEYMAKYVNRHSMTKHYFFIVDLIKEGNSKRLGKLAWQIEASGILQDLSTTYGQALNHLKKLLPDPKDESEVLPKTIATLHVPDFLPKDLWKHGIELVDKYFE